MTLPSFLLAFAEEARLTDYEVRILRQVGVRGYEEVVSVLDAFPSIADDNFRLALISSVAARHIRSASTSRGSSTQPRYHPPGSFGAKAPHGGAASPGSIVGPAGVTPQTPAIKNVNDIDLRRGNWPVRDQGNRGTCVAFGAAACAESEFNSLDTQDVSLSPQFLHWAIKDHSADPDKHSDGTFLEFAQDCLSADGICLETLCPYVALALTHNPVSGARPTQVAISDAAGRRSFSKHFRGPGPGFASDVYQWLCDGRPVAITLPVFHDPITKINNWETSVANDYGRVVDPPNHSHAIGGHCVCVTGFVSDLAELNGGYFVFRNSWGTTWASLAPSPGLRSPEAGYGEVSATYLEEYGWEALQIAKPSRP